MSLVRLIVIWILAAAALGVPGAAAQAADPETGSTRPGAALPPLNLFIQSLPPGQPAAAAGVYAPGLFALPVVQQPAGQPAYTTPQPGVLTEFSLAGQYGATGLLAHNTLAGAAFFDLPAGSTLFVVSGSGSVQAYRVVEVVSYRAISPRSPFSRYENLAAPEPELTAADLFLRIYARPEHLILQTCIEANGDDAWGRLFVIAGPEARVFAAAGPAGRAQSAAYRP